MKKLYSKFFFCLLIIFIVSSCNALADDGKKALIDTSWKLITFGSKSPIEASTMTAKFSADQIQGSASCNHYFGDYKVSGDQITIEGLAWTEMACMDPAGIMEQEQTLMNLLSLASEYSIDGNQLLIKTTSGKILVFERLAD